MSPPRRGPPLRLRRATLDDAAALARVQRASVRGLARGAYSARQIALWTRLGAAYHRWALSAGGEIAFVAARGAEVLGYAAFTLGPPGEVTAVFVRPAAAGQGVGTALLARVEAEACRHGARRLVVKASLNGAPFYRARGYRGARRIRVPLPDGAALDALRLAKALGSNGGCAPAPGAELLGPHPCRAGSRRAAPPGSKRIKEGRLARHPARRGSAPPPR